MRKFDIAVISVIAIVIAVGLITTSMKPSKVENNSPNEKKEPINQTEAPISVSGPAFFDSFGSRVDKITVNDTVIVQSEITNKQDKKQPLICIVQVRNAEGLTVSLSYIKLELFPNDTAKVGQPWFPTAPGKYYVEAFFWDSIEGKTVLSTHRKISVEVTS